VSDKTFLGNPCKRGHPLDGGKNLRYRVNGACVQCTEEDAANRRTAAKQAALAGGATLGVKEAP
jgi:hypothetical protein